MPVSQPRSTDPARIPLLQEIGRGPQAFLRYLQQSSVGTACEAASQGNNTHEKQDVQHSAAIHAAVACRLTAFRRF